MSIYKNDEERLAREAEDYLKEYAVLRKLTEMRKYETDYFGKTKNTLDIEGDAMRLPGSDAQIRMKMFEIRRFVLSLGGCNEKLFLFYHYIHGESVSRCAELMQMSRRSGFRLKKRALCFAGRKLRLYFEKNHLEIQN